MSARAPEATWPRVIRTKEFKDKIKAAKVLCVGAGGIGCELLKTLVLTGFQNIEVIDLDTIETSNLNRQFLFRRHHVGQSKAQVAADVVRTFAPAGTQITPHQANVKEGRFDVDYFKSFDIVLNGLDNLDARRHVNRLCLAADRPLVESGTAGYLGQVTVHLRGQTECFECQPKPVPKSFPICTLRNTPDKPIHCVVWAKDLLFNRLFGRQEQVTDLDERSKEDQQQLEQQQGSEEQEAAAAAAAAEESSFFQRLPGESSLQYACRVFTRVFTTDIERVISMTELWKTRKPPVPLQLQQLLPDTSPLAAAAAGGSSCKALGLSDPQATWSTQDSARAFINAVVTFLDTRPDEVGSAVFDKDDCLAVEVVAAAANLRAACYGIPAQSLFAAKGMAGNIIHAIATTNAIISGIIVTEACKIIAGLRQCCRSSYLNEKDKRRLVAAGRPDKPVKTCVVCGTAKLSLRINTATTTLAAFVAAVVKRALSVNEPTLMCGGFMYEEGEGLEEDEVAANAALLPRKLCELPGGGLRHGSILSVQDQCQHFACELIIAHQDEFNEEEVPDGYVLEGAVPAAATAAAAGKEDGSNGAAAAEDDDDMVMMDQQPAAAAAAGAKRSRPDADAASQGDGAGQPASKRSKVQGGDGADAPIDLADDDEGGDVIQLD